VGVHWMLLKLGRRTSAEGRLYESERRESHEDGKLAAH